MNKSQQKWSFQLIKKTQLSVPMTEALSKMEVESCVDFINSWEESF